MNEASRIADGIMHSLSRTKSGTLRFFGDWFGKPMDNEHRIIEAVAEGDCLVIRFDEGETLRIWDPVGFEGGERVLRIKYASRVRWEWYYYGRPRLPENLFYLEYIPSDRKIECRSNVNWYVPKCQASLDYPAAELW